MDKDKLLEYLEIMCKRCMKHGWCVDMGKRNGCTHKKEIRKYIELEHGDTADFLIKKMNIPKK